MPRSSETGVVLAGVRQEPFGAVDGQPVSLFCLTNSHGLRVRFVTYGGTILSLEVPDRHGIFGDIALGYASLDDYVEDRNYFGCLIGRYANRIADGRFNLDGRVYELARNDGRNHLHGGVRAFHRAVWNAEPFESAEAVGAVLQHRSPAGDEGYPGALRVRVTYTLTNTDELIFDYHAETDAATPVNLTQHTSFNLAGHDQGDVLEHRLRLNATRFTPVSSTLIPTGEWRSVRGTAFDFTSARRIGEHITEPDEQLDFGSGYDHNFVLDQDASGGISFAARLSEPRTGRILEIYTTEPALQFYSGNAIRPAPAGKHGRQYRPRAGLALETQHYPDSPNQPAFPSTILRPREAYSSRTVYRFSTEPEQHRP